MTAPLRIVHALEKNRLTTGSVVQMLEAARGLAARGHRVTVVSRPGGDLEAACGGDSLEFLPLPLRSEFDLGSARAWRRAMRAERPDIVHVHKGRPHSLALLAAAGLGPRPVLVVNRGVSFPLDPFNKWKYRHPRVGAVVCVAEAIREIVIRSGGLPPEKVQTIHAGTDTSRFDPARVDTTAVRRELGLGPDELLVTQVSVRDWKGWRELAEAFALVADTHPRARLLLVGCEPEAEREKVVSAAGELGTADRLLTLPYRTDMPEVLGASDIVADASWAGTGITGTIREAMAMERAVLATDCAGNRELVLDGEVGLLVPQKDVAALASALDRLLSDAALRDRMGAAGRRRVLEGFSTEVRLQRLEDLYIRLCAEPRRH
ncbi:MAG: glycosyltransferase family 4 protein [Acidobacteria bacterium]|nr:glycosyltransferase family 4 protein [Acidobacteriota bacterium]